MPASTSPVPGQAKRPLPVGLIKGTSLGELMTVPEPFSTTVQLKF
jgi:hypothetical protein